MLVFAVYCVCYQVRFAEVRAIRTYDAASTADKQCVSKNESVYDCLVRVLVCRACEFVSALM